MARRSRSGITVVGVGVPHAAFDEYGSREPVAPRRYLQSQSTPNIDWPGLVSEAGENSRLTIQEPNGTSHEFGNGGNQTPWGNWNDKANGPKWSGPVNWNRYGKANRTGE